MCSQTTNFNFDETSGTFRTKLKAQGTSAPQCREHLLKLLN